MYTGVLPMYTGVSPMYTGVSPMYTGVLPIYNGAGTYTTGLRLKRWGFAYALGWSHVCKLKIDHDIKGFGCLYHAVYCLIHLKMVLISIVCTFNGSII